MKLAKVLSGMFDIAETAMPDSFFQSDRRLVAARNLLQEYEWSQECGSEGAYMGGPPLSYHAACPECGGLKDTQDARGNFIDSAFGHRPRCQVALALKKWVKS